MTKRLFPQPMKKSSSQFIYYKDAMCKGENTKRRKRIEESYSPLDKALT